MGLVHHISLLCVGVNSKILYKLRYYSIYLYFLENLTSISGENITPFTVTGASETEYLPIRYNDHDHWGAKLTLDNTCEVSICFPNASTVLSRKFTLDTILDRQML